MFEVNVPVIYKPVVIIDVCVFSDYKLSSFYLLKIVEFIN